jgi:NADH-quinone oxidoreductase E subunit
MSDKKLRRLLDKHKNVDSLLLLLKEVQEEYGYIPDYTMNSIAESLDVSVADVYSVGTFYSFISTEPQGKNIIRICNSVPCYMKNSRVVIEAVENALGIKADETTSDGKFSLQLVNCIGACDKSPAMMINDTIYDNLTPEKIPEILNSIK